MPRRIAVSAVVVLLTLCTGGLARAQADAPRGWYMDVQRYHPTFDTLGGFQVESSEVLELWRPAFGLHFNYANRPLVQYDVTDGSRELANALVGDLMAMDVSAALGFRYADLGIIVPVTLAMVDKSSGDHYGYPDYGTYSGVGDVRIGAKGRFLDPRSNPVGLGLLLPVSLPSGNAHVYNGTWGASIAPQFLVETIQLDGKFHAAVNVGPYLTPTVVYESVDGREIIRNGSELRLGAHVGYRVAPVADVSGEIIAAFGLGGEAMDTRNPVEWRLGGRFHPMPNSAHGLTLDLAVGSGMSAGIGAPAFRLVFGATFIPSTAPDEDKDKIPDAKDACPYEAEDRDGFQDDDGCPEPDNDNDGVLDGNDQCPDALETPNGFEDGDGCPDEDPDTDGDGIANGLDDCPDEAEDVDGFLDDDGCPEWDNDNDGVPDTNDTCPQSQEVFNGVDDWDGCEDEGPIVLDLEGREIRLLDSINFLSKKAVLEDDAKALLDAVATLLIARPDILQVEVQVHTDDQGDDDFNLRFSDARAQIVRLYLVEKGVPEGRLVAKGYGETQPIAEGTSRKVREANRRIEFKILDVASDAGF